MSKWAHISGVIEFIIEEEYVEDHFQHIKKAFQEKRVRGTEGPLGFMITKAKSDRIVITIYGGIREPSDDVCDETLTWLNASCKRLDNYVPSLSPTRGTIIVKDNNGTFSVIEHTNKCLFERIFFK